MQTYLGQVDGSDLVGLLETSTVDEYEAAEKRLVAGSGALGRDEADEELDAEGAGEALLAIGAHAREDNSSGHLSLERGNLLWGKELALAEISERGEGEGVEADDAAVEGDLGALVRLGGEGAREAVAGDSDGAGRDRDTVGVAADEGAGVLLSNVLLGLFWAHDDVVRLRAG